MLLSMRTIAVLTSAAIASVAFSEGFISVSKHHVSILNGQRIMRSIGAPIDDVLVRHASTIIVEPQVDEKELIGKLRSSTVTNVNNELVPLGDIMGSEKSVVVFLRHLG